MRATIYLVLVLAGLTAGAAEADDPTTGLVLDAVVRVTEIVDGDTVARQLLQGESTPADAAYLDGFRHHDELPPPDGAAVRQSLRHRQIILEGSDRWRLRVPLMQRWLRERG